jgi:hypothetical protein
VQCDVAAHRMLSRSGFCHIVGCCHAQDDFIMQWDVVVHISEI